MNASNAPAPSIDPGEVALFGGIAEDWWNPNGSSKLLHQINPVRLAYIREHALDHFGRDPRARCALEGLSALDVGCGAGLLTEPMARMGAKVTGLDAAPENVAVARAHAESMGLAIDYRQGSLEALADGGARFDIVTCLEVVEHVADLDSFLAALARVVAPGGMLVFSTPNRTPQSYLALITLGERLLRFIPKGAHDWNKFLTPDELRERLARAGLAVRHMSGLRYNLAQGFEIAEDMSVNYIGVAVPASASASTAC